MMTVLVVLAEYLTLALLVPVDRGSSSTCSTGSTGRGGGGT